MVPWTKKDIPSLSDKIVVVTGATGGLGYETALHFISAGATVIVSGRNESKGDEALEKIKALFPEGNAIFRKMDLCSLASISEFASWFLAKYEVLDILINNAGVGFMSNNETRRETVDGFETQLGTNHLAHFALTNQLLPALKRSRNPRVVNISSIMSHFGKIDFTDLQREKISPNGHGGYSDSKLANILFTFELQRRSDANGYGLTVTAAHPGLSRTTGADTIQEDLSRFSKWIVSHIRQSAEDGALISLYAATVNSPPKEAYYGPQNCFGLNGHPGPAWIPRAAKNKEVAKKLWDASETLTKVTWPGGP